MCGINGLFYFDSQRQVDDDLLIAMRRRSAHRGPDDIGLFHSGNIGFGFNRLSIIDIAGGHQPMSNEDGSIWIVFNGEIYNFAELRSQLSRAGHRFRTHSDTETILKAWQQYGDSCVEHLCGMFAFAIWDARQKLLFAARDRLGIKPFYYYVDGERFAFASEIKSLLAIPQVKPDVDMPALADYLRHGYALTPHTLFKNVRKLPAAHTIKVQTGGIRIRRYWEVPRQQPGNITELEAIEELRTLFSESIQQHLISDVPVGVFLSGGLDSSSVVAMVSRVARHKVQTFSIGYDSTESELPYAQAVARHCGSEHHEIRLTHSAFRDALPEVVWHMDEPIVDVPSVPLYYLSRFARSAVTVALSGEGADEVFGGYPTYNRMLVLDRINKLPFARLFGRAFERWAPPGKIKRNGSMLGRPLEERYRQAVIFAPEEIQRLLPNEPRTEDPYRILSKAHNRCRELPTLSRMSYLDLTTWLPDDLLLKADRMSMAHSLEVRVPFLDHKIVEFGARLPSDLKVHRGTTKYLLKKLMEPVLPAQILHRPKIGFSMPTKRWFRGPLSGFVREKLLARDGPCLSVFPRHEVARLVDAHKHRDCTDQIYALLVFDEWCRTFMRSYVPNGSGERDATTEWLSSGTEPRNLAHA